ECCDSNNKCCPKDKPLRDKDGNCYACDDEKQVNIAGTIENCAVCSNRLVSGSKKYCVLKCGLKGTSNENKPLMDTDGKCYSCDNEVNVNVTKVTDNCKKCPSRYLVTGTFTGDYCALCGVAGTTVEDKKALNTFGTCQSCNDSNLINVHGIESSCLSICPNRILLGDKCYPACPTDKPLRSSDGECHTCDWNGIIKFSEVPDCLTLCPIRAKSGHKEEYCTLATCPADKPLIDKDGKCFACDEEAGVNVTGVLDNCKKCPSRYLVTGTYTGDYCALCGVAGTTVADKKALNTFGTCQSCEDSNLINVHGIESSCLSLCPNRMLIGDKCYREYCSETVPLEDIDGKCHPCNEPLPIDVGGDETKCSCINRTLDGQYCILNDSTS
ncbi:MAG: hypothetical protein IKZ02_02025, partial [Alphaproteobacteria bacterium]|nr:hypothetical protein [Alphaproteobacteria bacterium]